MGKRCLCSWRWLKQYINSFKAAFSPSGQRELSQACQVMSQFSIVGFDRICVRFTLRDFIHTPVIPQAIIGIESIAVVAFGLRNLVDQFLNGFLCALSDHLTAQIAAGETINNRDDVDLDFFLANEAEQLIHLGFFDLVGHGWIGEVGDTRFDKTENYQRGIAMRWMTRRCGALDTRMGIVVTWNPGHLFRFAEDLRYI